MVIGGTGFIGTPIIKRLFELGHEVKIFHRGQTNAGINGGVFQVLGDRQNFADFRNQFKQIAPDVVLDVIPYFEQDANAVMQTFRGIAGRVIALSSQDVYRNYGILWGIETGEPNTVPISEDAPLRSVLYPYRPLAEDENDKKYNYDKIPVEQIIMSDAANLPGTILRLPAIYGEGDMQHRFFEIIKRMNDNRNFIMLEETEAKWRWTHGYLENVAEAIVLAVTDSRAANRIYNVGEKEALTRAEWIESIAKIIGWEGEILALPKEKLPEHLHPPFNFDCDLKVDTTRIRKELGFEERVSRNEALRKTITWEQSNPPSEFNPQQFNYAAEDAALADLKNIID